jgi:uncharacterized surface protein with fasciclin (FAS1) repeats
VTGPTLDAPRRQRYHRVIEPRRDPRPPAIDRKDVPVISRRLAILAGGMALLAGCQNPARIVPEDGTIDLLTLLRDKPEYRRFVAALQVSGLASRIGRANGPVTLFVPLNEGFNGLPAGTLAVLDNPPATPSAAQQALIAPLVQANAAWGLLRLQDIAPRGGRITTWDRARLQVTQVGPRTANLVREGQPVRAGQAPATITRADILAADGVLHITSAPLLPAA